MTRKAKTGNAPQGAFVQPAQLPTQCRWARARLRGWNDYANGKGFRDSYDLWKRKAQFAYERGRMQAALTRAAMRDPSIPLPLWGMSELIQGPMYRALNDHAKVGRILDETRVARRSYLKKKKGA